MDKKNPPETLGVFKPVGHTIIVYPSAVDMESAATALVALGFESTAIVRYSPEEMAAQADQELQNAGALAAFGYELDLVRIHREQAQGGCSFLVVHAPDHATSEQVAAVARTTQASAAQHYGRFMIEELLAPPAGQPLP